MIFVLTYNHPHKKTQDLLFKLQLQDYDEITVVSTPWVKRKNFVPLIPYGISSPIDIYPKDLCKKLNYNYLQIKSLDEFPSIDDSDYILIGAAGVIKKELADTKKIINVHPAYLPYVRGLDSFKWAILHDKLLGATTHIISEEIDQGWLINRKYIPLFEWDTFHSVAVRQYDIQIDLLANSVNDLQFATMESLAVESVEVHRRMPHRLEKEMIRNFPNYLKEKLTIPPYR